MKKVKRIMTAILVAGLLLTSLTGCDDYQEQMDEVFERLGRIFTSEDAEEEEIIAEDSDESERSDVVCDETEVKEDFLEYTLNEEQIAVFDTQLLYCEELLRDEAAYAEMEEAVTTLDELAYAIQNQASIAEVLYYCDMKNEQAEEDYLFSTEVSTEITADYLSFVVDLYDSGAYEELFADWLDIELKYLEYYSEETTDLQVRNAEILAEFYDLQEDEFEEHLGVLYSEFITNCNEIAQKSGFANYYEYVSTFGYMRDYGKEERERFREYVKEYIIPLYNVIYDWYGEAYYNLPRKEKRIVEALVSEEYDSLETDYVSAYFEALPEEVKTGMQHMFKEEAYTITDYGDALESAFTTDIGMPYCYFGPGYQDSFTMIHELGHYYADLNSDTAWISYDLCEVHSQGNEVLFLSYLKTVLEPATYEALEAYKMYYFVNTIVQAAIMDDFEESIYNLSIGDGYTTEEFDEIMDQTVRDYGIADEDEYTFACMEWLWRNVAISSPVYYLSYGTSAMAALSLYSQSVEDYEAALESYRVIQREIDMESSFIGTMEKAGILNVFEEEVYLRLLEIMY